ncbi:MAG TPA: hypothetical protein VFV75_00460 [Candidatus Polarisedimenticolaceae bacterium]|nr:hypothetical protein [Candidatus Polarisedimenticolaceae bacterium]
MRGKATFSGKLEVRASVGQAFPLFSPPGEVHWVPGWNPEFVDPPAPSWEEGQIFRTREERGEAVWVVARLDRATHEVTYYRVEPGRYVARIDVVCRASASDRTEVSTTYAFVGLSEFGNGEIAAMTQEAYDGKMARWTEWIERHLGT